MRRTCSTRVEALSAESAKHGSLCIVGNFPPTNKGGLPTQGEKLAAGFSSLGIHVDLISRCSSRMQRWFCIMTALLFNRKRWDWVCIQVFGRLGILWEAPAIVLARLRAKGVILVLRSGLFPEFLRKNAHTVPGIYRLAHVAVCPSGYLAEAAAQYGIRTCVIPNVICLNDYSFRLRNPVEPRLLWLRTFHPIYNPGLALRVFALIKAKYPSAQLTMAGIDRGFQSSLQRDAANMSLKDVYFSGFVPKNRIPELMSAHDIYLNTPHTDNVPVTVLEALACGLLVISTRVAGIPYLLSHEDSGLLVGDDDAEEMAAAVTRLLEEPFLATRLSLNGKRLVENYTWEKAAPLWRQVLAEFK